MSVSAKFDIMAFYGEYRKIERSLYNKPSSPKTYGMYLCNCRRKKNKKGVLK